MIRITEENIVVIDGPTGALYPRRKTRTTIWLFWVVPLFVYEVER